MKTITESEYLKAMQTVKEYKNQVLEAKHKLRAQQKQAQLKREAECGDHYYLSKGKWQSGMTCQDCGHSID